MAELRQLMTSLGHSDVTTYIQTGNVIFTTARADLQDVAGELETALAATFSVRSPVIVLSRAELAAVIRANPYQDEENPRYVHCVFLPADPGQAAYDHVAACLAMAAGKGSRDEAVIIGRTVYLHTPDGFGTSELAREVLLNRKSNPLSAGTARNWNTTTKLLALCGD